MATLVGKDGVVKIGSNAIGEIRSYSIEQTMDVIEDSVIGDTDRTYTPGLKSFLVQWMCFLMTQTQASLMFKSATPGQFPFR